MAEKKRLHSFLSEMLKLSCVKGFQHFATHMRGREEMVCSIVNEPSMSIIQSATNSPAVSFGHHNREAFPMSQKQQRRLSGYGFINVGLPPASPSENEEEAENQTMFLIAGYSRYNRPYVWVRTNHERLVRLTSEEEKDYPLLLQTTSQWQEREVKVWDVLTELVEVCTAPCPPNPFAVDLDYFQSLQLQERALASAAMIAFLQKLISSGPHHYDRRVCSDIRKISRVHFQAMLRMLQEGIIQPPSLPSQHDQPSQSDTPPTRGWQQQTIITSASRAPATEPSPISTLGVSASSSPAIVPTPTPQPIQQPLQPALPHFDVGLRPQFTPAPQYGTGISSTTTYPRLSAPQQETTPQVPYPTASASSSSISQPTAMAPPQGTSSSRGQFYSRRMEASYNY